MGNTPVFFRLCRLYICVVDMHVVDISTNIHIAGRYTYNIYHHVGLCGFFDEIFYSMPYRTLYIRIDVVLEKSIQTQEGIGGL